jgi:hypothetical protein
MWVYVPQTTVGAGLPIIGTLKKDLLQTGDKIVKVEGIFSGVELCVCARAFACVCVCVCADVRASCVCTRVRVWVGVGVWV